MHVRDGAGGRLRGEVLGWVDASLEPAAARQLPHSPLIARGGLRQSRAGHFAQNRVDRVLELQRAGRQESAQSPTRRSWAAGRQGVGGTHKLGDQLGAALEGQLVDLGLVLVLGLVPGPVLGGRLLGRHCGGGGCGSGRGGGCAVGGEGER